MSKPSRRPERAAIKALKAKKNISKSAYVSSSVKPG
jgi:hypothetical protein